MNHINQVTRILNTLYDIDNINIYMIAIQNDLIIIKFFYKEERVLQSLYNKLPDGYLVTTPEIRYGELSFILTEPDNDDNDNQKPKTTPFAYPDED